MGAERLEANPAMLIEESQRRLDRARRSWLRRLGWRRPPGAGSFAEEIPVEARSHYDALARDGRVVWGAIVQANEALLQGKWLRDLPALAVWGAPGDFDAHPGDLLWIAMRLASLKNRAPVDPELAQAAEVVTNESSPVEYQPLPNQLTGPTPAGAGRILVHTGRLPEMRLKSTLLPLVVAPERTPIAMIAPESCWPSGVREDPTVLDRLATIHLREGARFALPEPLNERVRTVRPRGAPPRISITAVARDALRAACGGAVHGAIVVRIDAKGAVSLSISAQCPDDLRTSKVGDLLVGYHPAEADELDGLRVDWSSGAFGTGFSLWRDVV